MLKELKTIAADSTGDKRIPEIENTQFGFKA